MHTLETCRALDAQDPLRPLRDLFTLPEGVIYLDGNSLGAMPKAAAARVAQVITQEWGRDLIRSWNSAGWFHWPQQVGDKIARLVGAGTGELVATDGTSINLFKVLSAALSIAKADAPQRRVVRDSCPRCLPASCRRPPGGPTAARPSPDGRPVRAGQRFVP